MKRVNIYRADADGETAISNRFIDEYMAEANDAQLKIYLFLIRMMDANLPTSVSDIADKFNYPEKDVLRALKYWESRQLLELDFDEARSLTGIRILPLEAAPQPTKTAKRAAVASAITPVLSFVNPQTDLPHDEAKDDAPSAITKPAYSAKELKQFKGSDETAQLLMVAEQYVGRPLTRSDMETILFMYDRLDFSTELIDYLMQHCVERGKRDFRYMEKVALSWREQGITTVSEAQRATRGYDKIVYSIMRSLGKSASPAPKELEYINKWTKEYGFMLDVIQEACDKTVMSVDSHRFAYADGILSKWYQAGVQKKADISEAESALKKKNAAPKAKAQTRQPKNSFNRFEQNSYDFDSLEENILSN